MGVEEVRTRAATVIVMDRDPELGRRLAGPDFRAMLHPVFRDATETAPLPPARAALIDVDAQGGFEALDEVRRAGIAAIATSRGASLTCAVKVMRAGAADILPKPFSERLLRETLSRILAEAADAPPSGRAGIGPSSGPGGFIGESAPMRRVYAEIARVAGSTAPVFVTGESGTGKELCAEAVHRRSPRHAGAFVAINCAAIPRDLMESELFGHMRGAFTGAYEDRPGAAELAHRGTLFLDEIGEMDFGLQAKLLRFLQTGAVQRVGDARPRTVDVRLVCATNREPEAEMAAGRLRPDLFYRLHVLPVAMPPLRVRGEDIALLAEAFLARFAAEERRAFRRFTPAALALLTGYDWPGNVRQLENVVRRIVVMNDGEEVEAGMVPLALARAGGEGERPEPVGEGAVAPLWRQEQRIIEEAIARFGGNTARAAAALEISPSTIYRKRQSWVSRRRA